MNATHVEPVHEGTTVRAGEWLLAIVGGFATILGMFVLFGSESHSIGLGGDYSWTIGELGDGWGYGLLLGGLVALAAAAVLLRYDHFIGYRHESTPVGAFVGHAIAFVLVNAFVWAQDLALGDGLNYPLWITVPWALGLAAQAYSVFARRGHSTPTA